MFIGSSSPRASTTSAWLAAISLGDLRRADAEGGRIHREPPPAVDLAAGRRWTASLGGIDQALESGDLEVARGRLVAGVEPGDRLLRQAAGPAKLIVRPADLHAERDHSIHLYAVPAGGELERDHSTQRVSDDNQPPSYRQNLGNRGRHRRERVLPQRPGPPMPRQIRRHPRLSPPVPNPPRPPKPMQQHQR